MISLHHPLRFVWAALLVVFVVGSASRAAADEVPLSFSNTLGAYSQMRNFCQFAIEDGRVRTFSRHSGANFSRESSSGSNREELKVQINFGNISLDYAMKNGAGEIRLNVSSGGSLTLVREVKGSPRTRMEFRQASRGLMRLTSRRGDDITTITGASLWELLLTDPQLCRQELIPLLNSLNKDWSLSEQIDQLEEVLLQLAGDSRRQKQGLWNGMVADLGSDLFQVRRLAEQRLRAEGTPALPYLLTLDQSRLDPEQRLRLRRVIDAVVASTPNGQNLQPTRDLFQEPLVWLSLVERRTGPERALAAEQLAKLLGGNLPVDLEAPPEVQTRQLAALREQLSAKVRDNELSEGLGLDDESDE